MAEEHCTWVLIGFRWREGCRGWTELKKWSRNAVHGLRLAFDGGKVVEDG